jgi:hypothetical protein
MRAPLYEINIIHGKRHHLPRSLNGRGGERWTLPNVVDSSSRTLFWAVIQRSSLTIASAMCASQQDSKYRFLLNRKIFLVCPIRTETQYDLYRERARIPTEGRDDWILCEAHIFLESLTRTATPYRILGRGQFDP